MVAELSPAAVIDYIALHWIAVSATTTVVLFVAYLAGLFQKSYKNAPPLLSSGVPILGNFIGFAKDPVGFVRQSYNKLGSVFTLRMFGQRITFLIGPEAHTPFFRASDEEADQAEVYKFMTPVFGKGIVYDAPLKLRMQQLKFVSASLKATQLRTYIPKVIMEAEMYFDKWADSGEVSLLEALSELTILTASRCLMGKEIRENLFEKVAQLYADMDGGITPLTVFYPSLPTAAHKKRNAARAEMSNLFSKVIQKRRASGERQEDCLQAFIECQYKDGSFLTDDAITGLMIALLFAGQHTSSITSTWAVLHMLHQPDILKRVMAEQDSVLGPSGELTWDGLNGLNLMYNCIKEVLRMWPPLIFLMRKAKKDINVAGYTVPAGDTIFAAPSVSMRLPSVYTNPDAFDPDRFGPGREEDTKQPFSYIGFGGGMHGCMGEQFAYLQIKTIVSVLLRRFELTPLSDQLPSPNYKAMVVGPLADTTRVRYKRRVPK